MRTIQKMSLSLPNEMASGVKFKAASGEYASESEVIREGRRALDAGDRAVENWLSEKVVPAYEALKTDSNRGMSSDEVRENLARAHRMKTKKA